MARGYPHHGCFTYLILVFQDIMRADKRPTGSNTGLGYDAAKILAISCKRYHIILTSRSLSKALEAATSPAGFWKAG